MLSEVVSEGRLALAAGRLPARWAPPYYLIVER